MPKLFDRIWNVKKRKKDILKFYLSLFVLKAFYHYCSVEGVLDWEDHGSTNLHDLEAGLHESSLIIIPEKSPSSDHEALIELSWSHNENKLVPEHGDKGLG